VDTRIGGAEVTTTAHGLTPRRAGGDERVTHRSLARLGAVGALGGALLLLVSTLLHPLHSDPNIPRAAFAEYAADSLWVWSHLGQFAGFAVLGMALVALAATGFSGLAMTLSMLASSVLLIWAILAGILMWRLALGWQATAMLHYNG
jgi:hypothetical protein